jgi:hypothetical protein
MAKPMDEMFFISFNVLHLPCNLCFGCEMCISSFSLVLLWRIHFWLAEEGTFGQRLIWFVSRWWKNCATFRRHFWT